MVGFITERHLEQAEEEFPGISRFFESCPNKPRTFLDLVALFEHWCQPTPLPLDRTAPAWTTALPAADHLRHAA